jgi:hypothetical protein
MKKTWLEENKLKPYGRLNFEGVPTLLKEDLPPVDVDVNSLSSFKKLQFDKLPIAEVERDLIENLEMFEIEEEIMNDYAVINNGKCCGFSSDLGIIKDEASKLAKKYSHTIHIVKVIGRAVPKVTIEVQVESEE